jgi:hypothetical protein
MASIMNRIEKFIADHELDSDISEDLEKLVKRCIGDLYEHVKDVPVQVTAVKEKSEKLDNPSGAQQRDDLRNCTKEVLNAFCKENGLRVGGTKKEVMDRVWRHLQDESSDEDISPRSEKKKKEKKVPEKIECCGTTAKGTPCNVPAENEKIGGKCYCWRHAKVALTELKKEESEEEDDE